MEMNIVLPEDQYTALLKIANLVRTQDHHYTHNPLYLVQQLKEIPSTDGNGNITVYYLDGCEFLRIEKSEGIFEWFSNQDNKAAVLEAFEGIDDDKYSEYTNQIKEHDICDDFDLEQVLVPPTSFQKEEYTEEYQTVDGQVYFTEEACLEHIKKYGHKYTKPRMYVDSAYRNEELKTIMNILKYISVTSGDTAVAS